MEKKLLEITNLGVDKMKSKQQVNMVTWYEFEFAVWRKRDV